jgi:hypothetical protein
MPKLRLLIAGAFLASCLASQVHAQQTMPRIPPPPEDPQKKRDAEAIDRDYKAALERSKNKVVAPADPWQDLRGSDDSKNKR